MEDLKEFYKQLVIRDKTILGTASNTLKELKVKWPDRATVIDEMSSYLLELRNMLTTEGWKGYLIKPIRIIEMDTIEDTLELISAVEAEKILAEKKARAKAAEDIAKAIELERLEKEAKKAALLAELEGLA